MTLSPEWRDRFEAWRQELRNHVYTELGGVELRGFTTREQLSLEEALAHTAQAMPVGTRWGSKWEYAWFRGHIVLPPEAEGQRIVLRTEVGGESAIYVNGAVAGARDRQHTEITLARKASAGTAYDVAIEAYAGHGPMVVHAGPTPPDRETVPEPPDQQAVVGRTTYGIWHEEVYQLTIDVEALYGIRENTDAESLRVAEIDAGLKEFTLIVDYEQSQEALLRGVAVARQRLQPLLEATNGSTAPTLYAFGHSHIDVAWLWPLIETEHKAVRTFATQLALGQEYPEFVFLQSQPHLFWMVQNHYPDLYARVKGAVREGTFLAEGGMWVEADTNLSGGESLIRQFLYGKRFFRDEFDVDCRLLWLPDVFGYSGALPQIMRGCGISYFATAKIFWAYHGGQPFPYNTFTWEGIDGSDVKVHLVNDYNSHTDMASLIARWTQRVQKDGISTRLLPFGFGDGGGGPTRNHLEFLRRAGNLEGVPKVVMAGPLAFFEDQERRGWPSERFVGELYFQAHRGTYTSQARTKRGNRKSEIALREAEAWAAVAMVLAGRDYPRVEVENAWRDVLLNQFHDIIPGSSIHRVYEEAEAAYESVVEKANAVTVASASALVTRGDAVAVFNSLGWSRRALVALPQHWSGALSQGDQSLPVQTIGERTLAEVEVPSLGWSTIHPADSGSAPAAGVLAEPQRLENEHLRVRLNARGEIVSIYDKDADRELAADVCNRMLMFKDVPSKWDAWDIDSLYSLTPVPLEEKAEITVRTSGPLVAELAVTRTLHESAMEQIIRLRRGSRRIDFETAIDWQERHKMLKVSFPVNVHAHEALHDIQFGHIRRPNHASMPYDADRFEVSNHKWTALVEEGRGCAVLNDCKYGVNVVGKAINLTLLKSALAPDMTADLGRQVFTYSFLAWNGPLVASPLVRESYDLNVPVWVAAGDAGERSLLALDAPNVVIEALKPAEDDSGELIVRLYESARTATRCRLTTSLELAGAQEADMLEEPVRQVKVDGGGLTLEFRPFEIKTLRLRLTS